MDDGPITTVLPKELRLGAPPTMPQARSYIFRQQATLSTYDPEQQIQINIPRLQRSYLRKDSGLQFRLNGQYQPTLTPTTAGQAQYAPDLLLDDAGAWGIFDRLEIFDYLGSTVLESVDNVPQLMSLLIDMGSDFTDPEHEGSTNHGLMQQYTANHVRMGGNERFIAGTTKPTYTKASYASPVDLVIQWPTGVNTYTPITYTIPAYTGSADFTLDTLAKYINDTALHENVHGFFVAGSGTGTDERLSLYGSDNPVYGAWKLDPAIAVLGLPTGTAVVNVEDVVGSMGIGIPFFQGGQSMVTAGMTKSEQLYDFSFQYNIPLPSFLGFLSKKMVPLHNGFTIVLTIANKYKPFFIAPKTSPFIAYGIPGGTAGKPNVNQGRYSNDRTPLQVSGIQTAEQNILPPTANSPGNWSPPKVFWWQLSDVSLFCHILELGPVAESMLLSTTQGQPLILHTKQFRNYRGNSSANQSEFQLPLNLNVASLTNLLWFMRPEGVEDNLIYQSYGARCRNFLQRWEFQYGSTTLPQSNGIQAMFMATPPIPTNYKWQSNTVGIDAGYSECFHELLSSRPTIPSKGRLTQYNFNCNAYPGKGTWGNAPHTPFKTINVGGSDSFVLPKFALGLNLELTTGKTGELICGLNTNGMNTSIRGYYHPTYLGNSQKFDAIIDAYAEYDAFINISPGIATTVSF